MVQAELSFNQAITLGLQDIEILEEIGDLYQKADNNKLAILAY